MDDSRQVVSAVSTRPDTYFTASPFDDAEPSESLSLPRLFAFVLRRRAWILIPAIIFPLIAFARVARKRPSFTAVSTFVPEGARPQPAGSAGAIASQLGVNLANGDVLNSSQFYPDMVVSRWFLKDVATAKYVRGTGADSATLVEIYEGAGALTRDRLERSIDRLQRSIDAVAAPRTGVITLSVTNANPQLAQQISSEVLRRITQFNVTRRQSRATAERIFIEKRLAEVSRDLRSAEDRLRGFLQENHDFTRSAPLVLEEKRLERELALEQQIYTSLSTSYEQAKIDEVRDTPLVTVLGQPEVPVKPNAIGRRKTVLVALMAGLALGLGAAFVVELLRRPRPPMPEFGEVFDLGSQIRADLRRGRFIRAVFGGRGADQSTNGR